MLRKFSLRLSALLVITAAVPVVYLAAQDNQNASSVAEAARRARQQRAAAPKPATVLTNDNLPAAPASTSNAPGNAMENSVSSSPGNPADPSEGEDAKKAEIDALKKEVAEKQQSLDVLQRELALEQENFYRQQDYQRDTAGKQKLDSMQADVKTKQDELSALKAKLTDLAGTDALKPAAPANPPSGAAQAQP